MHKKILSLVLLLYVLPSFGLTLPETVMPTFRKLEAGQFNCKPDFSAFDDLINKYGKQIPTQSSSEGFETIQILFQIRLTLKNKINLQDPICLEKIRDHFYRSRSIQDAIYVKTYAEKQVPIKDFDFKKMDAPNLTDPAQSNVNPAFQDIRLQAGDIMIAKGISFTSSTISQLAVNPSQLSHIALFIDYNGEVQTLEAYIGKGVDGYPLTEALKNENARILVLRPKDPELARLASQMMVERYEALKLKKEKIKYDYDLNLQDHSRLTCAEVAINAFEIGSKGGVIIPEFASQIQFQNETFINTLGLKNGPMMMPDDMEFDSRFDTVLEWTDVRILQDSLRKDQIMKLVLQKINAGQNVIQESYKSKILGLLWKSRNISWLWPLSAKILGLPEEFDADVPLKTLKLSLDIESTGQAYLEKIYAEDLSHYQSKNAWLSEAELSEKITKLNL